MPALFNGPITAPDVNARIAPPKPGFDDVGGLGETLRMLAGHLMQAGGLPEAGSSLLDEIQNRQKMAHDTAFQQQQLARLNRPEGVNLGNGGYGTFDPSSGALNILREPTAPREPSSETERILDRWKNTPPGPERDLLERVLKGYQYTQPVMDAQQRNRIQLKQVPTYANLHPKAPSRAAPKPPAGFILD